jgi:hypothetical protein
MGGRIATLQAQTLTLLIDISISATWKSIKTLGLKNHAPRFYAPCLLLKLDLVYPFANNNIIIITWHTITSLDMPSMASPLQLPLCKCFHFPTMHKSLLMTFSTMMTCPSMDHNCVKMVLFFFCNYVNTVYCCNQVLFLHSWK